MSSLRWSLLVGLNLGLVGCQGYDVDPVQARVLKPKLDHHTVAPSLAPHIVFVVDRSGSMRDAPTGQVNTCGSTDPALKCKWQVLLDTMVGSQASPGILQYVSDTLSTPDDPVQMGLVLFAGADASNACAAGDVAVNVTPTSPLSIDAIGHALLATSPAGATPTADTMALLGSSGVFPANDGRASYAILLTDGAPNCNAGIAPTASACGGDRCTLGTCGSWDSSCGCFAEPLGCLDDDRLATNIGGLLAGQHVKTIVVGFGADTSHGAAHDTLNRAAIAGGQPRQGTTDAYYQASNPADLRAELEDIIKSVVSCDFALKGPLLDPALIEVSVTLPGQTSTVLTPGQFSVDEVAHSLHITDPALCSALNHVPPSTPASVEIDFLTP